MILNNIKSMKKDRGFTIVELLIVIVVIGILAAIVIVAYQGVQSRARAAQYQTDVTTLVKKSEAYNALNSAYPLTTAGTDAATVTTQTTAGAGVVTAINSTPDTKLPSSLSIFAVVAYATTVPTYTQAMAAINANASINAYFVAYCTTGKGMRIYYPDPTSNTVKSSDVGVCP